MFSKANDSNGSFGVWKPFQMLKCFICGNFSCIL